MLNYKHPLLTAILLLALAFTLSCSSDDGGNDGISSPSGMQISSSTGNDVSSSSGQTEINCVALNKNMPVKMNLNNEPIVVTKNGNILVKGTNYQVIESQNSVKVDGLKDYIGSVERVFEQVEAPEIVIKDGSKILAEEVDYVVTRGEGFVKVYGINDYYGSVEVELPICPEQEDGIMYHGHIWTPNPTNDELGRIISGEIATDGRSLIPSEVTNEGKTITFRGRGVLCIMISTAIGQITSLKDALNTENLGSVLLFRGEITYNGINYYLYTAPSSGIDGLDFNLVMSF
jgi:hypothetical protein